ncbi:hypothetical protein DL96DRAFT_1593197 [Flagelloscypha sp. PMI_526]|nr:hypothetical protein DL96DRAFT_1593197 [Flagelloscypha sp. PMI_526]
MIVDKSQSHAKCLLSALYISCALLHTSCFPSTYRFDAQIEVIAPPLEPWIDSAYVSAGNPDDMWVTSEQDRA